MQTTRQSKISSLSSTKSITTLWTARLVATLWKLAVKRVRILRRQSQGQVEILYGSEIKFCNPEDSQDLVETSIMHEAALSVVASGIVSLADLEAVTGFRLSNTHKSESFMMKDDDDNSEAATDFSDACSITDSDESENVQEEEVAAIYKVSKCRAANLEKSSRWICVGYGRYVKMQD